MIKKAQNFLSRINGFSTPLGGVSWVHPHEDNLSAAKSKGESLILTVCDCAQLIQVSDDVIIKLLESGDLGGLLIDGEWRVAPEQIISFLAEKAKSTQFEVLSKQLQNHKVWKKAIEEDPEFKMKIESSVYSENSMGRFLQDALASDEKDIQK